MFTKLYLIAATTVTLILVLFIFKQQNRIIMNQQEMLALLIEADKQTNEIAEDIKDLVDNGNVSGEVAERLTAHVERLKAVASTHTPARTGGGETPPPDGGGGEITP